MKHFVIALLTLAFALSFGSAFASLTQTEVSQLYIGVFGRASEGSGNSYWQSDPQSTSMTATANVMLNTDPAKAYFGGTMNDNAAFVAHIYSYTLGKSYADDPNGQDYWVSELVAGKSKGEMIAALISAAQHPDNAGEAQDRFNNKVKVSNYCADNIFEYSDLATFTGFLSSVTGDASSVTSAELLIDTEAAVPSCDSNNPNLCTAEGSCLTAGGYWYSNICNSTPLSTCDSSHLDLCIAEGSCFTAGGYWYNNTCNSSQEGEFGTVTSAGQIWMDRNLGASRVATSSIDSEAYGDLYQWGRGTDGHEKRTSSTTSTLSPTNDPHHSSFILPPNSPYDWKTPQNNNLWQGVAGNNNPCPSGFRLPTDTELEVEMVSWDIDSGISLGAFASPLKLVVAGYRHHTNGKLYGAMDGGVYWSSTVDDYKSRYLAFYIGSANTGYSDYRAMGYSVRCIKD